MFVTILRPGQSVVLELPDGRTVEVKLLGVGRIATSGELQARLGFKADKSIPVHREEVARAIAEQALAAASGRTEGAGPRGEGDAVALRAARDGPGPHPF